MTYIYALFDPREPEKIRYVGKTINLYSRMHGHRNAAKSGIKSHVYNWIKKLWKEDVDFEYKVIDEVADNADWEAREQYWIKYHRDLGHPLTNQTDGGEGPVGMIVTEETRKKMSEKKIGNKINEGRVWSEESRQKARDAIIGTRPNRPAGKTGYKYVSERHSKVKGKTYLYYDVRIQTKDGLHRKTFKTAEQANEYAQEFLRKLAA